MSQRLKTNGIIAIAFVVILCLAAAVSQRGSGVDAPASGGVAVGESSADIATRTPTFAPTVPATIASPTDTPAPTPTPPATKTQESTSTLTTKPTDTPVPLPTVLVPETMEGLASILLQPGDLPAEWKLDDEIYNEAPVDYDGPRPVAIANANLVEGDGKFASGGVVVYIFSTEADAGEAFDLRSDIVIRNIDKGAKILHPPYGRRSMLAPGFGDVFALDQLVFQRCRIVVEMQLGLRANGALVGQYAPRLDERLTPTACR